MRGRLSFMSSPMFRLETRCSSCSRSYLEKGFLSRSSWSTLSRSVRVTIPISLPSFITGSRPILCLIMVFCIRDRLVSGVMETTSVDMNPLSGACPRRWCMALSMSVLVMIPARRPSSMTGSP